MDSHGKSNSAGARSASIAAMIMLVIGVVVPSCGPPPITGVVAERWLQVLDEFFERGDLSTQSLRNRITYNIIDRDEAGMGEAWLLGTIADPRVQVYLEMSALTPSENTKGEISAILLREIPSENAHRQKISYWWIRRYKFEAITTDEAKVRLSTMKVLDQITLTGITVPKHPRDSPETKRKP